MKKKPKKRKFYVQVCYETQHGGFIDCEEFDSQKKFNAMLKELKYELGEWYETPFTNPMREECHGGFISTRQLIVEKKGKKVHAGRVYSTRRTPPPPMSAAQKKELQKLIDKWKKELARG